MNHPPHHDTKHFRIFVASPSDRAEERDIVTILVEELNRTVAAEKNIHLELIKWETHVAPDMGRPQEIINRQIPPCDLFVGIMWNRFGTSTGTFDSGTEEEFNDAYERWKQTGKPRIMFYFRNTPYILNTAEEVEQVRLVLEFKGKLDKWGLTGKYTSVEDFQQKLRSHLINVLHEESDAEKEEKELIRPYFLVGYRVKSKRGAVLTKKGFFSLIVNELRKALTFDTEEVIQRILERENLGSTSCGDGAAIPHAHYMELTHNIVAMVHSDIPIEWDALDQEPARFFSMILIANRRNSISLSLQAFFNHCDKSLIFKNPGALDDPAFLEKYIELFVEKFPFFEYRGIYDIQI